MITRTIIVALVILIFSNKSYSFDIDKDILKYRIYTKQKISTKNTFGENVEKVDDVFTGKSVGDVVKIMKQYSNGIKTSTVVNGITVIDNNKFNKGWSKYYYDNGKPYLKYKINFNLKVTNSDMLKITNNESKYIITFNCNFEKQVCDYYDNYLGVQLKADVIEDFKHYNDIITVDMNGDNYLNNILVNKVTNDVVSFIYNTPYDSSFNTDNYIKVLRKFRNNLPKIKMIGKYGQINNDSDVVKVAVRIRDTIEQEKVDYNNDMIKKYKDNNIDISTSKFDNNINDINKLIASTKYEEALQLCINKTPKDNPYNCIYNNRKAFILLILGRNNEAFDVFQNNINRVCEDKDKSLWQEYVKDSLTQIAEILNKGNTSDFNLLYNNYLKKVAEKSNSTVW